MPVRIIKTQTVNPYEEKTSAENCEEGTLPFWGQRKLRLLWIEKHYSFVKSFLLLHYHPIHMPSYWIGFLKTF